MRSGARDSVRVSDNVIMSAVGGPVGGKAQYATCDAAVDLRQQGVLKSPFDVLFSTAPISNCVGDRMYLTGEFLLCVFFVIARLVQRRNNLTQAAASLSSNARPSSA